MNGPVAPFHSRRATIAYTLAAIPAAFLPLSYLVMVVWVIVAIFPSLFSEHHASDPVGFVYWIPEAGMVATFIQWPFYILWAACTRRLTIRVRVLWVVALVLFNMLTIPWFLYCMYRGTAQTALTRAIRSRTIRKYFEQDADHEKNVA